MFSKGTPKAGQDSVPSIISHGTQLVGDVSTDGEVQIDGKVEGNIRCHTLIVAETGEVTGKVSCESVTIHGTLTGTVQSKSVTLSSSARGTLNPPKRAAIAAPCVVLGTSAPGTWRHPA